MFDLGRMPTEDEIAKSAGITRERYRDILKATRPVHSLNVKHPVTQEELINGITDTFGFTGDKSRTRSPDLLRLALDDVVCIAILIQLVHDCSIDIFHAFNDV